MDLKPILTFAKRNTASLLAAMVLLSSGFMFLWNEYKDLSKQKDQLVDDRKVFNDERAAFEKDRTAQTIATLERKAELDKRELSLLGREKESQAALSIVQQRTAENNVALKNLKRAESVVSAAQRTKLAEEKIEHLMSEFSALGVNLNALPKCGDEEARYKAAQAKYSEILAVSKAYRLESSYKAFLLLNAEHGSAFPSCSE
jgi:hypothetical protein